MPSFLCPVCHEALSKGTGSFKCPFGHSFDQAKSGYVNLFLSQTSKGHGDDRQMVKARKDFLDKGFYRPVLDAICGILPPHLSPSPVILDAGCGECWYTAGLEAFLLKRGFNPRLLGVDISKNALAQGAKRSPSLSLAVASVFHLPLGDESCDLLLNLFSPYPAAEYRRVLRPDGLLLRAFPLENHLLSLKEAVYDSPYRNETAPLELEGYRLLEGREIRTTIALSENRDIQNLFTMTPYYYKTSREDIAKLDVLDFLETQLEVGLALYRKTA